jgi:hypothetical protein
MYLMDFAKYSEIDMTVSKIRDYISAVLKKLPAGGRMANGYGCKNQHQPSRLLVPIGVQLILIKTILIRTRERDKN